MTVADGSLGILDPRHAEARAELVTMLVRAYWLEIETVMNYLACSVNPDGVRARQVVEMLAADVGEELGHARRFAERIKELYGVVPGSQAFRAEQRSLQPPAEQTDLAHVVRGVIEAETAAIEHYQHIVDFSDGLDPVTNDLTIAVLADEQRHRRLFEGFLRELEADGQA